VTAEACTGGRIAKACTDLPAARNGFEAECRLLQRTQGALLGVSRTLASEGAVSEAGSGKWAVGALEPAGGEVAIAVSGIAVRTGVCPQTGRRSGLLGQAPATTGSGSRVAARFAGDRAQVRRRAVHRALAGLLDLENSS